jgi:hypothetical protein
MHKRQSVRLKFSFLKTKHFFHKTISSKLKLKHHTYILNVLTVNCPLRNLGTKDTFYARCLKTVNENLKPLNCKICALEFKLIKNPNKKKQILKCKKT